METKELAFSNHELAASATQAQAKAEIECAYIMAIRRPRKIDDVRIAILAACRRPIFAASAEYSKPIGGKEIRGPSIRFAETAFQCFGNIRITTNVIYDDQAICKIRVSVIDLENNNAYGTEATVNKTIERKRLKNGQKAISERLNSFGETVYLVEATEDEIAIKKGALVSKMIRNCGLRLIPRDIVEEAMEEAEKTVLKAGADPVAEKNKLLDAFGGLGVMASDLEKFLRKPLAQVVAKDLLELRKIFTSLRDGESVWSDWLEDTIVITPTLKPPTLHSKLTAKSGQKPATAEVSALIKTLRNQVGLIPPPKLAELCMALGLRVPIEDLSEADLKALLARSVSKANPILPEGQTVLKQLDAGVLASAMEACNLKESVVEALTEEQCSRVYDTARAIERGF